MESAGAALVLDDVEVSDDVAVVDEESDALGLSVDVLVSVGVALGESSGDEESLGTATALALRIAPPPVTAVFEAVRTVDVVGGEPQSELGAATDACAAMELTSSTAAPRNASPIAAPSAAGLRSSALTVHPRFN
ncbi:MAG: hypothetical protein ACRDOK_14320 [Streptosporangiaceae bacterium]